MTRVFAERMGLELGKPVHIRVNDIDFYGTLADIGRRTVSIHPFILHRKGGYTHTTTYPIEHVTYVQKLVPGKKVYPRGCR